MKIILCGKGGCGKSTISTLLARQFAANGKKVLVIDSDESNFGLHRQLGFDLPKDFTGYFGGKKKTMELINNEQETPLFTEKWTLRDIPSEYLSGDDQIKLIAIGKIHDPGEGCACPMGKLAARFLENIEDDDNVVIEDTEAGVEHFGRGVDARADVILMVIDTSYESLKLAVKVKEMGEIIGKPVLLVLNKVNETKEQLMRESLPADCRISAAIPENTDILAQGLKGDRLDIRVSAIETLINEINRTVG